VNSTKNNRLFYAFYDALFAAKDYSAETDSVLELGGIGEGRARILELGCGTGNHTRCFAGLGHSIVGVDPDEEMLTIARTKLRSLPKDVAGRIDYRHGQVHDLPLTTYDLATALFNVINYIPTAAALESLMQEVARRLKPGASFIFDVWNGSAALTDPPADKVVVVQTERNRVRLNLTARTDFIAKCTELTYFLEVSELQGGRVERGESTVWHFLWSPAAIVEAAQGAGLEPKSVHPLFDRSRPATERDWKLMFHFRKRPGVARVSHGSMSANSPP
jgi:SAM-dependent methyltransferase